MAIDRVDWHWDSAEKLYRENHDITAELTEEQANEIGLLAGNHIGLFVRWLIEHDLEGEDADEEDCLKVKSKQMTGTEYLMNDCDGKFWEEDVKDDVLPFVETYYESSDYFRDYAECCIDDEEKPLYGVISSEEDYLKLKKRIDHAYAEFQKIKEVE